MDYTAIGVHASMVLQQLEAAKYSYRPVIAACYLHDRMI